jgi:hypothetical protein
MCRKRKCVRRIETVHRYWDERVERLILKVYYGTRNSTDLKEDVTCVDQGREGKKI